jgi:hypothetical protein
MSATPYPKPRPVRAAGRTSTRPPACPVCRSPRFVHADHGDRAVDVVCPNCPLPIDLPAGRRPIPFTITPR